MVLVSNHQRSAEGAWMEQLSGRYRERRRTLRLPPCEGSKSRTNNSSMLHCPSHQSDVPYEASSFIRARTSAVLQGNVMRNFNDFSVNFLKNVDVASTDASHRHLLTFHFLVPVLSTSSMTLSMFSFLS